MMIKKVFFILLILCNSNADDNLENVGKFFVYPSFKSAKSIKAEIQVFTSSQEKKMINQQEILNYFKTTLRSRLGMPLDKLKPSIPNFLPDLNYDELNIGLRLRLNGPYNQSQSIYWGIVDLTVSPDEMGRQYFNISLPIANSKDIILKDIKSTIDILVENFVKKYFDVVDFDIHTLTYEQKIKFLFNYRKPNEYPEIKFALWDDIKNNQELIYEFFKKTKNEKLKKMKKNNIFSVKLAKYGQRKLFSIYTGKKRNYLHQFCIYDEVNGADCYNKYISHWIIGIQEDKNKFIYFQSLKPSNITQSYIKNELKYAQ